MKRKTAFLLLFISALLLGGYFTVRWMTGSVSSRHEHREHYTCPMHPQIVRDAPGDCPICGMRLVPIRGEKKEPITLKKTMYRSSMNPNEVSDQPGKDSMGMEMIPFEVDEHDEHGPAEGKGDQHIPPGLVPVAISSEKRALMGLAFTPVTKRTIAKEIRTSTRIVPDETRQYIVTTKINGWVERLYVNQTGQFVSRGAPLLTIYSQELFSAQQEYLSVIKSRETLSGSGIDDSLGEIEKAARERLRLLDVSDAQIERIAKTGKFEKTVTLYSPASGYVMEKTVLPGKKIMMNDSLMTIVDLSRVWGEVDIYESDLPNVKMGMPAEVTLPYWPGKTFRGRITFLNPFLKPELRTLLARIEIPNPGLTLKPNMYGTALLKYSIGKRLAVPEQAVLRTGTMDYVFIQGKRDQIVPYSVTLGTRSGDGYYEVIAGLKEGERVVTSAMFLVDSEASLKAAFQQASHAH